jgi:hypothetical protein
MSRFFLYSASRRASLSAQVANIGQLGTGAFAYAQEDAYAQENSVA